VSVAANKSNTKTQNYGGPKTKHVFGPESLGRKKSSLFIKADGQDTRGLAPRSLSAKGKGTPEPRARSRGEGDSASAPFQVHPEEANAWS